MLSDLRIRLRALFRRKSVESEMDDELRFHFDQRVEQLVQSGVPLDEAKRRARLTFGGAESVKEECREARGVSFVETLWQDVRYGLRMMRRSPGFTIVAVLTLALGIGATTAMFSLIDAVALRNLPVVDASHLVFFSDDPYGGVYSGDVPHGKWAVFSYHNYEFFRDHNDSFTDLCAFETERNRLKIQAVNAGTGGVPEFAYGKVVCGNYFSMLGVKPAAGRTLVPDDDRPGAPNVAVMSYAYWRSRFNADPSVVGLVMDVNDTPFTIVGVAPPEFFGESFQSEDFWFPLVAQRQITRKPSMIDDPESYWLNVMGRMKPGVTLRAAQAEVSVQLLQMLQSDAGAHPSKREQRAISESYIEMAPGSRGLSALRVKYSESLHVLMAIAGLVLLIVCANIANLQLSRGAAREKEVSVRLAVGASRWRLARQFLTESILLSALGGFLGILLARWGARALFVLVAGTGYPVKLSEDTTILCFAIGVSLATGVLFGLVPAISASRQNLSISMKDVPRTGAKSAWGIGGSNAFVIAQIAAAVPLLVATGLLARTLSGLMSEDLGYHEDHILLTYVDTSTGGYTQDQMPALFQSLLGRISALPGVHRVTLDSTAPLSHSEHESNISFDGYTPPSSVGRLEMMAHIDDSIGADYFETLGIPILRGRDISAEDIQDKRQVAVINATLARTYLPGVNPVGLKYCLGSPCTADKAYEIVGVAGDARYYSLREAVPPTAFNTSPDFSHTRYIAIRAAGDPGMVQAEVVKAIAATANQLPPARVTPLRDQVLETVQPDRILTGLVAAFGGMALLVACIGLYGTMSYRVARRTKEIGVRLALGAQRSSVVALVMKECAMLVAVGLMIGIPMAFSATWIIASQLFGVSPRDPLTTALAAVCLAAVAAIAGAIPAWRAMRVDPMVALRYE